MTDVVLLPATVAHLVALQCDRTAFGRLIGSPVPEGWPEFGESIDFTLDRLRDHPDERDWWMHFFVAEQVLIGSGGFVARRTTVSSKSPTNSPRPSAVMGWAPPRRGRSSRRRVPPAP